MAKVPGSIWSILGVERRYRFSPHAGNRKTGVMAQGYTSGNSCAERCSFNHGNGCYAAYWNTLRVWKETLASSTKSLTLAAYCKCIESLPEGSLFRHGVAGDFATPGTSDLDKGEFFAIMKAAHAAKITLYGYTHCTQNGDTLSALKSARVDYGCIINASCERLDQAKMAQAAGCDAVLTAPELTPELKAAGCILCPAIKSGGAIHCAQCKICAKHRKAIVVFTPHGAGSTKVIRVLRRLNSEDSCNF